jgi:uroporphyrinogen-III synthase
MNKKLYDLKMQILREKGISDWLKKELSEQVFQIEQELAINYTRCCEELCECAVDCVETEYNKDFVLVCKKCQKPLIA